MIALTGGTTYAAVFGTGLLASLSPCVYPMLPITIGFFGTAATQSGSRRGGRILLYALGQVLAFVGLGAFAVFSGESLGFTSESPWVCFGTGALLLGAGAIALTGRLPGFFARAWVSGWTRPSGAVRVAEPGGFSAFALGVGSALVASPCTSPILGGVLALMASQATLGSGLLLMVCYSFGFSALFVLLGLGVVRWERLPRSGEWMVRLHQLSAWVLAGGGVWYLGKAWVRF